MSVSDYSYLIIGGTTKSATTSVFNYLGTHQDICASSWKETGFFLAPEYPNKSGYRLSVDGLGAYDKFYLHCSDNQLRLEATPEYLYSPGTAEHIRSSLPDVKLIFLLREPISRLISWYGFALQRNMIQPALTFDEYVRLQFEGQFLNQQPFHALEQGRYSGYLLPYMEAFNEKQILVCFFEDIKKNPSKVMKDICSFANISYDHFLNYEFESHNRTETWKIPGLYWLYISFIRDVRRFTHKTPLQPYLKKTRRAFEPWFVKINRKSKAKAMMMNDQTKAYLSEYYRGESSDLEKLLGCQVPWGNSK